MLKNEMLYALGDVTILPAVDTDIRHRNECNVFYDNKMLPIFTAPMDAVVDRKTMHVWEDNHINPIMPRTETLYERLTWFKRGYWIAVGLEEFEDLFLRKPNFPVVDNKEKSGKVLIDIANGHMKALQEYIPKAKEFAEHFEMKLEIMVGNIAHPETYEKLAAAGADYVRCGIGGGSCCITSSNSSIHMPMATLLDKCRQIKNRYRFNCAIIADGGINSFANANKALALGADYVMMGSLLCACIESAAELICPDIRVTESLKDSTEEKKREFINEVGIYKKIYGMSTKEAQKKINPEATKLKTSEGITRKIQVQYTVAQWVDNYMSYLRSAMSYTGFTDIKDYVGGPLLKILSESAKIAINK